MVNNIRIVSGGTGDTTKVYVGDSLVLDGVVSIQIHKIKHDTVVKATIKFRNVELDIQAEHDKI